MKNVEETIPQQIDGTAVNVEDSVQMPTAEDAKAFFTTVKARLLAVNKWKEWAGTLSAGFQLTDSKGIDVDHGPQVGNFFRINIPAPGIISGEGYDWVRVEEVKEEASPDNEYVAVRVRPASSPTNDREDVAHFYTDDATSNFIVERKGSKVTAGVYGRNEKPNVDTETIVDKVRNAVVGTGAVTAFSKLQWKALVSGLLERK
jgi:hypothetical protein